MGEIRLNFPAMLLASLAAGCYLRKEGSVREKRKGLCVCQDHVRVSYLAGLGRQRQCFNLFIGV